MYLVNTYQAKTDLSGLISRVMAGEEIVIAKAGKPVVRLVPVEKVAIKKPGLLKGKIVMGDDFDSTPEEIVESFYASEA